MNMSVRSARSAGASWSQIGAALGTSKQAAWEAHGRWIDDQAEQHRRSGFEGLNDKEAATARAPTREPGGEDPADGTGAGRRQGYAVALRRGPA